MKKTLFATALVCALTIFGFAATAQASAVRFNNDSKTFSSKVSKKLNLLVATSNTVDLSKNLSTVSSTENKTFGYLKNGTFVSLAQAVSDAKVSTVGNAKVAAIRLGEFNENDTIQFGINTNNGENNEFTPYSPFKIQSDPGYYGGYNAESFYQLDFSNDPFDGMIEIVIGEPLPAPVVTLIVALAAGALFLLYKNRKQRPIHTELA